MTSLDHDRSAALSPSYADQIHPQPFPLTHAHISQALACSSDAGSTLNFSKLNLSDIGLPEAEDLANIGLRPSENENIVERIALSNNRLTTLPTEFARITGLRYLNLKHNHFLVFPHVLTLMPSLDTLDISHNKIRKLPSHPGQLVHLRVFCFSRNKITKLPSYLPLFRKLEILKLDRNPIEWPPPIAIGKSNPETTGKLMKEWIQDIQDWIETETRTDDDLGYSEQLDWDFDVSERYNSWRFPIHEKEFDAGVTPHARTFSIDSNISLSSIPESLKEYKTNESSLLRASNERPPPLHLGILELDSGEFSPTRSLESYLPSPAESDIFEIIAPELKEDKGFDYQHMRNVSYVGGNSKTSDTRLLSKKSLPDLRTTDPDVKKRGNLLETLPLVTRKGKNSEGQISPLFHQDIGSRSPLPAGGEPSQLPAARAVPSMTIERNSYFRRLSTLPTTTALPKPLLCLVDTARSILFVMCQVHQAIEHYVVHAIDERLSSVLKKVLDPASADMLQLIRSLEIFDNVSQKVSPPPAVCRSLVESCRDAVAVFNKALGVLALQLKVIATCDDIRYSRWILLELHAATVEISCAWQSMMPYIEFIKPLMRGKTLIAQPASDNNRVNVSGSIPSPSQNGLPRMRSVENLPIGGVHSPAGRTRTARRHAGSFSSKDVEIGKQLPSYEDFPNFKGDFLSGRAIYTPTLRIPKRQATFPSTTNTKLPPALKNSHLAPELPVVQADDAVPSHSRHGSQGSLHIASSLSPLIPFRHPEFTASSNSKTTVDKEALQAVLEAVEVAPSVWNLIEEEFANDSNTDKGMVEHLAKSRAVTKRLSGMIQTLQDDPTIDRKILHDDARLFLKSVVRLSNIIKARGTTQSVSPLLRSTMVKLTNATEVFAILLHVSSFSPSTPRSYSPMLNLSSIHSISMSGANDDNHLITNLSRARSAQASPNFSYPLPSPLEWPRSALPNQTFKLPTDRRPRNTRETRPGATDPG